MAKRAVKVLVFLVSLFLLILGCRILFSPQILSIASSPLDNLSFPTFFDSDELPDLSADQLIGKWNFVSNSEDSSHSPVHLVLMPQGYAVYEIQNSSGASLCAYEGEWILTNSKELSLNLSPFYISDVFFQQNGIQSPISVQCSISSSHDKNLNLSFNSNQTPLPGISLADTATFELTNYDSSLEQSTCIHSDNCIHTLCCSAAMDYYSSQNSESAEYSRVAALRPAGLLIHLYNKSQTNHVESCAWYIIDPYTLEGYAYLTGEPINFNVFSSDNTALYNPDFNPLCSAALAYHQSKYSFLPSYAVVDSVRFDGLLIQLYNDTGTTAISCAWYVIDPDTYLGYDYLTGEKIDFSTYVYSVKADMIT